MTGETKICDKDIAFLKELFETKLEAIDKATFLANDTLKARLEQMNEFRNQLKDQAASFATRNEVDLKISSIEKNRRDSVSLILAVIALLVSITFGIINIIK